MTVLKKPTTYVHVLQISLSSTGQFREEGTQPVSP